MILDSNTSFENKESDERMNNKYRNLLLLRYYTYATLEEVANDSEGGRR